MRSTSLLHALCSTCSKRIAMHGSNNTVSVRLNPNKAERTIFMRSLEDLRTCHVYVMQQFLIAYQRQFYKIFIKVYLIATFLIFRKRCITNYCMKKIRRNNSSIIFCSFLNIEYFIACIYLQSLWRIRRTCKSMEALSIENNSNKFCI